MDKNLWHAPKKNPAPAPAPAPTTTTPTTACVSPGQLYSKDFSVANVVISFRVWMVLIEDANRVEFG